jgi:DNA-binding NtrC family response regulator
MCHVLVIEDDWLIAEHIIMLAREAGATSIDQADNQQDAIIAARDHKPEMILSDVRLTSGTGPLAVQAIIAEHGDIPVIFITGTPEDCAPCAPPGVILGKPIIEHALKDTFRRLAPKLM